MFTAGHHRRRRGLLLPEPDPERHQREGQPMFQFLNGFGRVKIKPAMFRHRVLYLAATCRRLSDYNL